MTSVPPTSGVNSQNSSNSAASAAAATAQASTVDYNDFLKLMVTELQNQDPTSPTDPTQYLSQLASFSSVEQQVNTNNKLDTMLTSQALTQADATIGRTATSTDGKTTGVVQSVSIGTDGTLTANLVGGQTMVINNGVTLS